MTLRKIITSLQKKKKYTLSYVKCAQQTTHAHHVLHIHISDRVPTNEYADATIKFLLQQKKKRKKKDKHIHIEERYFNCIRGPAPCSRVRKI